MTNQILSHENIQKAFVALQKKEWSTASSLLNQLLKEAEEKKDNLLLAVAYSCLGLSAQLQKDWKESWRNYEKAEKLFPENIYYKLIVARLLFKLFGQNDTAIKRCEKILLDDSISSTLKHQVNTLMGLAYLKKGDRKRATKCLLQSVGDHFAGIDNLLSLDTSLLEAMTKKKVGLQECKYFLEEAKILALNLKEMKSADLFTQMLIHFPS